MRNIGLFETKTRLSEICQAVHEKGETIIVTRRGKPYVRIEPIAKDKQPHGVWEAREKHLAETGPLDGDFSPPPRHLDAPRLLRL